MPDGSTPPGEGARATAAEVLEMIQGFAARAQLPMRLGVEVRGLRRERGLLGLDLGPEILLTRRLVVATGEVGRPFIPSLSGCFEGPASHVRDLRPAEVRPGARVGVVGCGNSGAEVAVELARLGARVFLACPRPPRRPRQVPEDGPLGELLWWLSGLPVRFLPGRAGCRERTPLVHEGLFEALAQGEIRLVPRAVGLFSGGLRLAGGELLALDRIVWATGYSRETAWLRGQVTLGPRGLPRHRGGLSPEVRGLGFLGLPCMRTRRSGFLRGFAEDADAVVRGLR